MASTTNFYHGLTNDTRTLLDATTRGFFIGKNIEATMEFLKEMATNTYQWPSKWNTLKKTLRVHELDVSTTLSSKIVTLSKLV